MTTEVRPLIPGLEVTDLQAAAVDRVARFIVRFSMTVPAILALETVRPLTFVGSQFMLLLSPTIGAFLTVPEWDSLAELLEDRRGIEYVLRRLEQLDEERP